LESEDYLHEGVIMDTYKLDSNGILKIINFDKYEYIVMVSSIVIFNVYKLTFYHKIDKNGNIINLHSGDGFNIGYDYDLQHLVSSFMNANSECLLFKNRIEFLEWIKKQPGLKNGVFYRKNIMSAD
jgi:YD repeat-containing protein